MRLTMRTKLLGIVATIAVAFLLLLVAAALNAQRMEQQIASIQQRLVPKLELGPRLEAELERMRRAFQDATAARDKDALANAAQLGEQLTNELAGASDLIPPEELGPLRSALEAYYHSALDVSRRLIDRETGEAVLEEAAGMQVKLKRTQQLLQQATAFDRALLEDAFAQIARAESSTRPLRYGIILACLLVVAGLSVYQSRGALRSLAELTEGLRRVGEGDFERPIFVTSNDEFRDIGQQANVMADSLRRLAAERDRNDWLKTAQADLLERLSGGLEPAAVAKQAADFLAERLEAPCVAIYGERDGELRLLGHHALSDDRIGRRFRRGEGLLGQAAQQSELLIVRDPPTEHLQIHSGLGQSAPRTLILAPLVHSTRTLGVLELALFGPSSDRALELLSAVREPLAIAIEVAESRAAMRELLAETQRQAERLAGQEEELRSNNEELLAQQEELQQTNEELRVQTAESERQSALLSERNRELDDARLGLEKKAQELSNVSAYKSQFLANMSHELRTPLNSMLLLSTLLADNDERNLSAQQVEYCRTIHSAGTDLLSLINQVLDLAKIESGRQEIRIEPTALGQVAGQCARTFGPLARDKGLAFEVVVDPGLPASIATDAQRLTQILTNLVGNAIKFTATGSVRLRIARPAADTKLTRAGLKLTETVAFSVTDTGPGIAREHQERIFLPFEQVDGAVDRRYGGTGLGLGISRELANLLGGELQLTSAPGQGSTFTCYLPYAAPSAKGEVIAPVQPAVTVYPPLALIRDDRATLSPGEPHLLLIEDDPVFARVLGDVIRAQDLKFVVVASGLEGLRWAKEQRPSGIILDVKLPDVDGFTVMERLRAEPATQGIQVHFLSAIDDAERGMAMGAVGYLTKPASRDELNQMVVSLAPRRTAQRILLVEQNDGGTLAQQLAGDGVEIRRVSGAAQAVAELDRERFDCLILDLSVPDVDGLTFLQSLEHKAGGDLPSVLVYAERALSKAEAQRLEGYADAVVMKVGPSMERLRDEIRLFVHRLKQGTPRRPADPQAHPAELRFEGKKLLVVDDDMRTVYALSATLRSRAAEVLVAANGHEALSVLDGDPHVDAVLMDIMMPGLDGYETMRRIRKDPRFQQLPIIALTAKAMKGDEEKCLEAGASDYLPKPIEPNRLLERLRRLLSRSEATEGQ